MADNATDARGLIGKRDRISDWNLGRWVDEYIAEHSESAHSCKPSVISKAMNEDAEIQGIIGKATVRDIDVRVYLVQRRARQEEMADKELMEGPKARKLTHVVASRVQRFVEMTAAVEAVFPESMKLVADMQRKAAEHLKRGEPIPKAMKDSWQMAKINLDMMIKAIELIKGDSTLQNIIKAQSVTQNIIQGIDPDDVPSMIMDAMLEMKCPQCQNHHWTRRDAMGAYARYQANKVKKEVIDAEEAPIMPTMEEAMNDPDGKYWDGELKSRE